MTYAEMIEDCDESKLTKWEKEFLESVSERLLVEGKHLMPGQVETLERLWYRTVNNA